MQDSHLFYTYYTIFIREWKETNLHHIVEILQCLFMVTRLKINLNKHRLLGIGVSFHEVKIVAPLIGCGATKFSFTYLRVMVGGLMSRLHFRSRVMQKVYEQLSRWKVKNLSISGHLTLLNSMLGSILNYYITLHTVSAAILS